MSKKNLEKAEDLELVDGNVLVTISPNKQSWNKTSQPLSSIYIPKNYTISHLRSYLQDKLFMNSQHAYFLFAYGCILSNNELIESVYHKFKHHITDTEKGLEIKYAEMSSFGSDL
jgi:hypothetical protein